MTVTQHQLTISSPVLPDANPNVDLALVFADRFQLEKLDSSLLSKCYPAASIVYCSTAGEIEQDNVLDGKICITAIDFQKTSTRASLINMRSFTNSTDAGREVVKGLAGEGLKHILVFADGSLVNGSDLVKGMNEGLPAGVSISGGLAGDSTRFEKTLVGLNNDITPGNIVAIGLFGDHIEISHGSMGGWDSFGPDRKITKSKANVLYELDGKSALSLYKKYLGDLAEQLPGSALLFPLSISVNEHDQQVVRTILSINEEEQSMTFAGNMPEGAYARLMKANFERLIDAAADAADGCLKMNATKPEFALLVSCVGRKIVLGQRIEEEIESVRGSFGSEAVLTGFYSYGEISPIRTTTGCELHNQTMTITAFRES
jgi:hypothetical protein